jgi:hypothetical protein
MVNVKWEMGGGGIRVVGVPPNPAWGKKLESIRKWQMGEKFSVHLPFSISHFPCPGLGAIALLAGGEHFAEGFLQLAFGHSDVV